jgi:predicted ester cyclase
MSQETRKVIEAFAQSHDPKYFAEDAVYTQMALAQPFTGRDAIGAMLRLFYHDAFAEARGDLRNVAADTEKGLGFVEFMFRGRHTGELMGIAPTGRQVEVPMFGVYEIANSQIQGARLYYDTATLMRQLGQMP